MTYHHGDLRSALLESGLRLLAAQGPSAVTLRAVARDAGVSHSAPYHHFADKGALITALAERGFEQLTAVMQRVTTTPGIEALERFRRTGVAYADFAFGHESLFRLMNRSDLRRQASVTAAAAAAYDVLERAVSACQAAGVMAGGDSGVIARTAWAGVHGAVLLILDGLLDVPDAADRARLIDEVTFVLGEGFLPR